MNTYGDSSASGQLWISVGMAVRPQQPAAGTQPLPVARPGLCVALGPERWPSAGVWVGPTGWWCHGAAGRRGEAGPWLEGARCCLGTRRAAVGGRLRGLRGVGLRGEAARWVLLRLLRRQLLGLALPWEGSSWSWLLAVGWELLRRLRGGLLRAVAGWVLHAILLLWLRLWLLGRVTRLLVLLVHLAFHLLTCLWLCSWVRRLLGLHARGVGCRRGGSDAVWCSRSFFCRGTGWACHLIICQAKC